MAYDGAFTAEGAGDPEVAVSLTVPVTTLCPCSKAISRYGAHNQRALVEFAGRLSSGGAEVDLAVLAMLLEEQGSAPVRPLVKRQDEQWLTERAYENPKFVEDVIRDAVLALRADGRFRDFRVTCASVESIHDHEAYATYASDEYGKAGDLK